MDESRTPTIGLLLTSNEVLNRNFRRIDAAFYAKANSLPLPSAPIDVFGSTPFIGLARTGDANLNHDLNLIDACFSASPPLRHGARFTSSDLLNANLSKIIAAFVAAGITPPPPDLDDQPVGDWIPADEPVPPPPPDPFPVV